MVTAHECFYRLFDMGYTDVLFISFLGKYMFIETSSPRQPGDVARLVSEVFSPVSASGRCIHFWYSMNGRAVDTLRVNINPQGKT